MTDLFLAATLWLVIGCAFAGLAWIASKARLRAPMLHALWLLALLRLTIPPVIDVPIPGITPTASAALPAAAIETAAPVALAPGRARPSPTSESTTTAGVPWSEIIALTWLIGTVVVLLLGALRALRFHLSLRRAEPASPTLARRVRALAAKTGLRRAPDVVLVRAPLPPLIFGFFTRARIVVPAALMEELDDEELDAILAHECAHLRRRDHWTRYAEWLATAIWWWSPVVWWARRHLRLAEEAACDERVLRTNVVDRDAYATGLLRTITWLASHGKRAPALAVGVEPGNDMRRRIDMILTTKSERPRARVPALLFVAAVLTLPLLPVAAQESRDDVKPTATEARRALDRALDRYFESGTDRGSLTDAQIARLLGDVTKRIERRATTKPGAVSRVHDARDIIATIGELGHEGRVDALGMADTARADADLAELLRANLTLNEDELRVDGGFVIAVDDPAAQEGIADFLSDLRVFRNPPTLNAVSTFDEPNAVDDIPALREKVDQLRAELDAVGRRLDQTRETGLRMRVLDESGRPVDTARVRILVIGKDGSRKTLAETVTDPSGLADMEIPPGHYRVDVRRDTYLSRVLDVIVNENARLDLNAVLETSGR